MNPPTTPRHPASTYRLQLGQAFGFSAANAVVPYLARLGVGACYSSPHFKANPGSTHGYDICDHRALNPELGGPEEYDAFCAALRTHGLGHVADIVPNHMAADPRSNPWWRDVLENGPSSPFAGYFDIDWDSVKPELRSKVLLPVLGDQYGRVLERGELQLSFRDGALHLCYHDLDLPVNPRQSPRVFGRHVERLEQDSSNEPAVREFLSVLTALQNLPPYTERDAGRVAERQREKEVARQRLARLVEESPLIRRHVEAAVREANGVVGSPASFDALHDLLEQQAYRLAYWRTASDEINYRRFFDINELVGLRMEEPAVFEATHGLVKRLLEEGKMTGLRVDHPDGLFDPAQYFERLQRLAVEPFYVVAEKILSGAEALPPHWDVAGTTGYGFLNAVSGLFVDARSIQKLRRVYTRLTGRTETFEEVAYRSRMTVMLTAMASELNVLAHALNRLSEMDRRTRDFTLDSCRRVLREIVACFPVYRTYITTGGASSFDREVIDSAISDARRRNPVMESSIFDFVRAVLLPDAGSDAATPDADRAERLRFSMKLQQLTAPVLAKGVEDTAFYRYYVLVSANDVGGHPGRPAVSPDEFHAANRARLSDWPLEMIATATHDTKRGEDARARINILSEMPDVWRKAVAEWMRINGRCRTRTSLGWAPDRNDEYLFYQALIGAWPAELTATPVPEEAPGELVQRISAYMAKAVREAKVHTSWTEPNARYDDAVERFVGRCLAGRHARRFLASFVPFQRRVARAGMVNALAQLALKLTSPGIPDFFQGTEFWDFALVDPDNRRPVDFAAREAALEGLSPLLDRLEAGEDVASEVSGLLEGWVDGRIKLFITARGLRVRRELANLLIRGEYIPLAADGVSSGHVVAFARRDGPTTLVTIVPRLTLSLGDRFPLGSAAWGDTRIPVPEWARRPYRHVITGETVIPAGPDLVAGDVFSTSPVAVLLAV